MGVIGQWESAEPGVRRKIGAVGQGVMNMIVEFEAGAEGYLHSHPHEQLTYVLYGELAFTIDGVTTVVKAGDSIYIPSMAKHGVRALIPSSLLDCFTPIREDLLG
ncbi:cupin domain-containing protein [Cohnella boryungensis]|uniref:Cupin domain-containing protein n=1 Tax=Cohnella boryungensis TaxID=768479 RepID=A0ABV8S449_9BACL